MSIELPRTWKLTIMQEKDRALEKSLFDKNTRLLQVLEKDLPIDKFDNEEDLLYLETQPRKINKHQIFLTMYLEFIIN